MLTQANFLAPGLERTVCSSSSSTNNVSRSRRQGSREEQRRQRRVVRPAASQQSLIPYSGPGSAPVQTFRCVSGCRHTTLPCLSLSQVATLRTRQLTALPDFPPYPDAPNVQIFLRITTQMEPFTAAYAVYGYHHISMLSQTSS